MTKLATLLASSPYQGYAYAYPHKTAYRRLPEPMPLRAVWAHENRASLFLYIHVPFCEMRCGFCNLFTQANPHTDATAQYLDALEREMREVRTALCDARFARIAIGGGTPTFLDADGLDRLFRIAVAMGASPAKVPVAIETSPGTIDDDRLAVLNHWGITRVSIGVQSFLDAENAGVMRPQKRAEVDSALQRLKDARLPTLNIDLIYGMPGQSVDSWLLSLRAALEYQPEELYLYPLYVRPGTGLGRKDRAWDDLRLDCYREARQLLIGQGYEQISMRMFRAPDARDDTGPIYCCQDDGMVGLGCGARSYTRGLHFSREYAVGAAGVRAILADYASRPADAFRSVDFGFRLSEQEQRRRYVIQSLLQVAGLSFARYRDRFGSDAAVDFHELAELEQHGLAERTHLAPRDECPHVEREDYGAEPSAERVQLTPAGLERSDVIGPWLYSRNVVELMESYEQR